MTRNIGSTDRALRIVVGLALVAWALWDSGVYHQWDWIGIVPLLTALVGWCLPYELLGINTCEPK